MQLSSCKKRTMVMGIGRYANPPHFQNTMSTGILQSAIPRVKSLQKGQIKDGMLFSNLQNGTIASAMSLLSNTPNYIESAVISCTQLFDIEILILCRVKNSQNVSKATALKHFVLWNTLIPTTSSLPKSNTGAVGASSVCIATQEGNKMDVVPRRPVAENREADQLQKTERLLALLDRISPMTGPHNQRVSRHIQLPEMRASIVFITSFLST